MTRQSSRALVLALAALYMAQGIPFGFATEYLPVVLRENGVGYAGIAALSWLQLPWQLKIFWAKAADHPRLRPRSRLVVLLMQLALTATVAAFAVRPFQRAPLLWFGLTFVAAALAATQDVFVDALAVRILRPEERGYGNTAQVAGYRLGMLIGGAALLLLVARLGEPVTLLGCASVVAAASVGAFVAGRPMHEDHALRTGTGDAPEASGEIGVLALLRLALRREAVAVLVMALTFKLGLHMASALLKPMAVDHGWTKEAIGGAVVSVGSGAALAGAAAGGALHRAVNEGRALMVALIAQALACAPLALVDGLQAPLRLTTAAIALEHFASGLGTTVLFAALMTATRPANAGLHYTVLTSMNAVGIGLGGLAGGVMADFAGKRITFLAATFVCLVPGVLIPWWDGAARASRGKTRDCPS